MKAVAAVTRLARSTIGRGRKDINAEPLPKGRVRRDGGGRRSLSSQDATLLDDLKRIVEPVTRRGEAKLRCVRDVAVSGWWKSSPDRKSVV